MSAHSREGHYREGWNRHIDQIVRSQHYTWLAEGLAGKPVSEALTHIVTDIMHICVRQGMSWETLVTRSRAQFEREEAQVSRQTPETVGSV
jgi:hypothetical protein